MNDELLSNIYSGIIFLQMVLFALITLSVTFHDESKERIRVKAVLQGGCVVLISFLAGVAGEYLGTGFTVFVNGQGERFGMVALQILYMAATVLNALLNCIPAVIVSVAVLIFHRDHRKIRIFTAILFMLAEIFLLQLFSELTNIFFSQGNDGFLRFYPPYPIRCLISTAWLAAAFFLYWKYLRKKLTHLLSYAEDQISSILLVPVLSYFVLEFAVYTLKTYGIEVMSIEPAVFIISRLKLAAFMGVYILMYWAIFKAVTVSAGSAKVKAELDVASQIQLSALPSKFPAFPKRHDFDIYASMKPAKEVGGDFYDFFLVDDDHLAVLIADVSGKGVPAALFMMSGRAVIHNQAMLGIEPGEIFKNANNQLVLNNKNGMFITAFFGIINLKNGEFRYCNAGHNVPYLCNAKGEVRELSMNPGFVLAGLKNFKYQTEEMVLEPGEKLVLYTDGVTEAINPAVEMYTEERLIQVLQESAKETVKEVVEKINASVDAFADTAEQFDDITILVVERTPETAASECG